MPWKIRLWQLLHLWRICIPAMVIMGCMVSRDLGVVVNFAIYSITFPMLPELNKIYTGDCLEIMKQWPDKCIDLCVTDPPYGMKMDSAVYDVGGTQYGNAAAPKRKYADTQWDNRPERAVFDEMARVSKNRIIFGGNYFTDYLRVSRCWVTWDKKLLDSMSNDFADCELAWTSFDSPAKMIRFMWSGMPQNNMKEKEERFHPTQKPIPVMRKLIEWFSDNTGLKAPIILDPFCGSGTTLIAAELTNRPWVGIEINPDYVKVAEERITKERSQLKLPL